MCSAIPIERQELPPPRAYRSPGSWFCSVPPQLSGQSPSSMFGSLSIRSLSNRSAPHFLIHLLSCKAVSHAVCKVTTMEPQDVLRRQVTESLIAQQPQGGAEGAVRLWELLATRIVSIVGDDGFNSLYARSVFLAQPEFPWIVASLVASQTSPRFGELKKILRKQTFEQASQANKTLLHTFISILASLIGDELTISILRSAWGNNASRGR